MIRATLRMQRIAKRLMVAETAGEPSARAMPAATFPVTDKLRPHLATLVGKGGVRALLARALVLATAEVTWLSAAHVNAEGDIEGLDAVRADLDPAQFLEGRVILLAQLLGLLVAFIGPGLVSRLISEIWPQVPLKDRDFGKEDDREEAR
ncbi:MAG: hypothetical protein JWP49_903 [Phenylobacterium sp.]|jgi:hypothetical protein|nr:hypothetical protein [Phenylobacterium sp.]